MKVLLLGNKNSVFVYNFAEELTKLDYDTWIFDPYKFSLYDSNQELLREFSPPPKILDRIPKIGYLLKKVFLRRIYGRLQGQFDICHIHYNLKVYSDIADTIARIGKKLVVSVWGSDFYKKSNRDRRIQNNIYDRAHLITFATEQTRSSFLDYYQDQYRQKSEILRLGLRPLEYIDEVKSEDKQAVKEALGFPGNSIVIVCGYNAKPSQNHFPVIDSVLSYLDRLPEGTVFVFPAAYGEKKYLQQLEDRLAKSGLKFFILDKFLSDVDTARLRYATDIFVNVQETDHLSGTMQEHLYAGCVVITGSWLPYNILKERGVFFMEVDSPQETGAAIYEALSDLEEFHLKSEVNPAAVGDLGRWDIIMKDWEKAYKKLLKNE